ncbi:putative methyltransferase YcgJ [Rhinoderma darwinii]|uniref:putative methyltransferase YcgJ n=1 Tax=Rhinoderma darwinii TaxID=43563 RepID=UPI003F66FE9B
MPFSLLYQKQMIPVSNEIMNVVLSYVKEKTNGQPLELAVDVGCGTGRYTLPLAPHFKKVLGTDISDSQIQVATQYNLAHNVSYMVAPAEKLPMKDNSVDLVNAGLAAHWFTVDKFVNEAARVLKTNGCLAVHAFYPAAEIEYKERSGDLTALMTEIWDSLFLYSDESKERALFQYEDIYETAPLKDKEWVKDIPVTMKMYFPEIIEFIQSICMFEAFKEKNAERAGQFLIHTEKRFREILGEEADSIQLNVQMKHFCVLACKH